MKIYKEINHVVYKIKDLIYQKVNLKCSIGISFSKSLAKYASKINKPDGITYITRENYHKYLDNSSIDTLCGVSKGVKNFLNEHGVYKCSDMKNIPISILANRFGNVGRKIWPYFSTYITKSISKYTYRNIFHIRTFIDTMFI